MPLIDGIGDEVTHFFIALCLTIVLTIAWWTTNTTDQRNVHAVVLLEHRRQRRSQQLTNHTESATISEGNSSSNSVNTARENVTVGDTVLEDKPPEASTSDERRDLLSDESNAAEEAERIAIVETMDTGTCELRQRRLAFYDNRRDNSSAPQNSKSSASEKANSSTEIENDERNYIEEQTSNSETVDTESRTDESVIRIKLKYINDDLKLVDGKLQEELGSFKRRHFEAELSANKLVRLIFNGQVLQQDSETLESCGLFDNCVVHCLVHPRRNNASDETNSNVHNEHFSRNGSRTSQTNNQVREWDLGNLLFALISFILGSAWYFRYVYAHLYTITATVALVAVTGIFTIVLIGMYFPEQEPIQRRPESAHS